MREKNIKILAIESSCDETAAAVIGDKAGNPVVLSSVISSQADLHAKTGGVVPEVASRAHMESIVPVMSEALISASQKISNSKFLISNQIPNGKLQNEQINEKCEMKNGQYSEAIKVLQNEITHIAVTAGPGLIGSLLVGFNAAKTMAYALDKPVIAVNHIEGHIYSPLAVSENKFEFPVLTLTVSGGHSSLTLLKDHIEYETIGETKDDAAGEAFDKVAKLLDLGYPGGPAVSKLASDYRNNLKFKISNLKSIQNNKLKNDQINEKCEMENGKLVFPRPIMNDGTFNFSFSGLKTAVLQHVLNIKKERELTEKDKEEICAAFEDASVDVLTTKAMRAVEKYKPKTLVLAGGVAANRHLREVLQYKVSSIKYKAGNRPQLLIPLIELCGDNAAMIGIAAFYHLQKGDVSTWEKLSVDSNLEIGSRS